MLSNGGLGITAKKCIYEGVIVPMALHGAETWGMRSAKRRKVNVLEKFGRSFTTDRAGIENELASTADRRVLRWFGHVERMDEYRMARRVLIAEVSGGQGTRETEVMLDGWCEDGLGQHRNKGGGCATKPKRSERVESPGTE